MSTAVADFLSVRSQLLGIAYHIVGRAADAEDVVQDAWVRWQTANHAEVRNPVAFLVTITRRLALNAATSAYARREVSAGESLPEFALAAGDGTTDAERTEALAAAVQLLMERLSPAEWAVYLLHEAFGYPFREIAATIGLSEANARQVARRARTHLREKRHNPVDPAGREALLSAVVHAARAGDMRRLIDRVRAALPTTPPRVHPRTWPDDTGGRWSTVVGGTPGATEEADHPCRCTSTTRSCTPATSSGAVGAHQARPTAPPT